MCDATVNSGKAFVLVPNSDRLGENAAEAKSLACLAKRTTDLAPMKTLLPFETKKRPCSGGGEHDRSYISAPRCVSGGEEARRVFADNAREEVSSGSGVFGSTREEVGGSETGV